MYLGTTSFSKKAFQCSAKRAVIVYKIESNAHAHCSDVFCSSAMFLTMRMLRVLRVRS